MNTRSLASLAVPALLLGLACSQPNFATLELFQLCFPPTPDATTGGCGLPSNKCDKVQAGVSVLDVGTAPDLLLLLQINNQQPNNADTSTGRVNTNDALILEYRIRYEGANLAPVVVPATPDQVPAASSQVSFIPVVPRSTANQLRSIVTGTSPTTVFAFVKAAGRFYDDRTFETGEYRIPVDVCNGCVGVFACVPPKTRLGVCLQDGQLPATISCQ
jgi:hypothetical protein